MSKPKLNAWQITQKELIIKDRFLSLYKYITVNPLGKKGYFWVAKRPKPFFVVIIPIIKPNTTLIIGQYRPPIQQITWEFPMGAVSDVNDPQKAAQIELKEETGFTAQKLKLIGQFYQAAGLLDQKAYVFAAYNLQPGSPQPEGNEYFETQIITFDKLEQMIQNGQIICGITIAAYYLFKNQKKHV